MAKKVPDNAVIVRVILKMPRALLLEIDRAWHKRELQSRAATIRALLREALAK